MRYHIRIKGHLDPSWQQWFVPLQIGLEPSGTTILFGSLPDQAALYGVLVWPFIWGLTEQMTYNGYLAPCAGARAWRSRL